MQRISGANVFALVLVGFCVASCAALPRALDRLSSDFSSLMSVALPAHSTSLLQDQIVSRCHEAVIEATKPYGVLQVETWSAGKARIRRTRATAPIFVEAVYLRRGGPETRIALIRCRVNQEGTVGLM